MLRLGIIIYLVWNHLPVKTLESSTCLESSTYLYHLMSSNKSSQNIYGTILQLTLTLIDTVHFITYVHATDAQDNQSPPIFSLFNDTELQISNKYIVTLHS